MDEGAERIVKRILEDARAECARTEEAGRERARAVTAKMDAEDEAARISAEKAARDESAEIVRRALASARLAARGAELSVRRAVIDEVFAGALEDILHLPEAEYRAFCAKLLRQSGARGACRVILPEGETRLSAAFFAEEGARCGMQTTLSDTRRPLRGGFVLEQEGVEYNCDFSALLTARRDELEGEVVAMLFGG